MNLMAAGLMEMDLMVIGLMGFGAMRLNLMVTSLMAMGWDGGVILGLDLNGSRGWA